MTRLVYRDPGHTYGKALYFTKTLDDTRWVPRHISEYHEFDGKQFTPRKRPRPDAVRILGSGTIRDITPERLGEYLRRPTAKALARIEAAEAAIKAAQAELKAAKRAAFTYGKPVTVAAVKAAQKARKATDL